jgi:glycosyltransferase involved in cell wall biosynthesis
MLRAAMSRRRVLVNALSLTQGGGRSYVTNVLRELDRDDRGFDVTVLVSPGQLRRDAASHLVIQSARLPGADRPSRVLARVLYEETLLPLRARRFDLLYCLADVAPALGSVPTVVALRNLNIYDRRFYDTRRLRALERLVRAGVRRARRVVFPSHAAAALIRRRLPLRDEQVAVVPHGISLEVFRDPAATVPSDVPYVFLPAALERHKNISVLIQSLRHVADPRLEAWIAGGSDTDPACAGDLRRTAESLGLEDRVRFLGPVPYAEVLRYYRGAAALVFPSLLETFGHPLLEAMASGTPVVAADIPAFREIAGDAALYFPPQDPVRLAREIDRALGCRAETLRRVEAGRTRAAGFSWKASVDRLCSVFEDALRSDPRPRRRPRGGRGAALD